MRTKLAAAILAAGIVSTLVPVSTSTASASPPPLSVMTRNLDLGSDYAPALVATDAASFVHGVTTIYDEVAASNIPERAVGVAKEIGQTMPDVVSLQEVSLVQRFTPTTTGLALLDQSDQLALLQNDLTDLGLHYTVAAFIGEFDVTAPSDAGYYLRIRDGEAILVRSDQPSKVLSWADPQSGHFSDDALLTLETPVGPVKALRGWASIDVTKGGITARVIDTHLDALSADNAAAQAAQILAGPASTALAVVLAGDLNSGPGTDPAAYNVVAGALTDTWVTVRSHTVGSTCCLHGEDYFPYATTPSQRIDLIFSRGFTAISDTLVGASDLTPSGLYPSDHLGVVARLAPTQSG
jgi:endonuclease/exonuclease/phosphatase family metal-dependent hydrolase